MIYTEDERKSAVYDINQEIIRRLRRPGALEGTETRLLALSAIALNMENLEEIKDELRTLIDEKY